MVNIWSFSERILNVPMPYLTQFTSLNVRKTVWTSDLSSADGCSIRHRFLFPFLSVLHLHFNPSPSGDITAPPLVLSCTVGWFGGCWRDHVIMDRTGMGTIVGNVSRRCVVCSRRQKWRTAENIYKNMSWSSQNQKSKTRNYICLQKIKYYTILFIYYYSIFELYFVFIF